MSGPSHMLSKTSFQVPLSSHIAPSGTSGKQQLVADSLLHGVVSDRIGAALTTPDPSPATSLAAARAIA